MINADWLENSVINRTLKNINLYSVDASKLILYTAGHESLMGKYDRQINGPALSIYQIEPDTFNYLIEKHQNIIKKMGYYFSLPAPEEMLNDLALSTAVCRFKYMETSEPLPKHDNLHAIAVYWKKHYNTELGRGTIDEFIENNKKFFIEAKKKNDCNQEIRRIKIQGR